MHTLGLVGEEVVNLGDGTVESADGEAMISSIKDDILAHDSQADEAEICTACTLACSYFYEYELLSLCCLWRGPRNGCQHLQQAGSLSCNLTRWQTSMGGIIQCRDREHDTMQIVEHCPLLMKSPKGFQ